MDNNINFKGAFLIKQPTAELEKGIMSAIGKKAIKKDQVKIFRDLTGEGDTLFVNKKCRDPFVAQVLLSTPKVKFKYYPSLDTESGFDTKKPADAINILKSAVNTVIDTKNKLLETIRKPQKALINSIRVTQEKNLKLMQKETFIDFNDKKYKKNIDVQTGMCTIKTYVKDIVTGKPQKHTLLTITPPGKFGVCYAKYKPVSTEEPTRRIAIKNGEKIFEYLTSTSDKYIDMISDENTDSVEKLFNTNVKNAKEFYKKQLAKKKS